MVFCKRIYKHDKQISRPFQQRLDDYCVLYGNENRTVSIVSFMMQKYDVDGKPNLPFTVKNYSNNVEINTENYINIRHFPKYYFTMR